MSDNTRLPIGTEDGDTYASDDIAGTKFQRVKLVLGADGTNDGDVSSTNKLPVSLAATQRTPASSVVSADGSVTAGKQSVEFVPSTDFTGTLLGADWPGTNAAVGFSVTGPETLAAFTYTVITGSITILTVT